LHWQQGNSRRVREHLTSYLHAQCHVHREDRATPHITTDVFGVSNNFNVADLTPYDEDNLGASRSTPFEGGEEDEGIPTSLPSSVDDIAGCVNVQHNPMIYVLDQLQEHVPSYWNNR
jgi:hypothetical protein